VLAGRPNDPLETLPIAANLYDPPEIPALVPSTLLARRPDVREAQLRIESAAGNLTRAELALLPTINLRPSLGLSRNDSDLFTSSTGFWSVGANLLVPILDRPRLLAEIGVNRARAEQAVIAYERAVQTAFSEADRGLIQLEADRARVDQLERAEASARSAYESARRGYQAGLTDLQILLDAERAWRGTRSALAGARTGALQRSAQVFQALGGGWSPEGAATTPPSRRRRCSPARLPIRFEGRHDESFVGGGRCGRAPGDGGLRRRRRAGRGAGGFRSGSHPHRPREHRGHAPARRIDGGLRGPGRPRGGCRRHRGRGLPRRARARGRGRTTSSRARPWRC
jgi:hypothetical protein